MLQNCLLHGNFLSNWKKYKTEPVHKKGNKQFKIIAQCHSKLLPSVIAARCSIVRFWNKPFQNILNSLYKFIEEIIYKKLYTNQKGIRTKDSYIKQLLTVRYNIYKSSDNHLSFEIRSATLYILKAIDRVNHLFWF